MLPPPRFPLSSEHVMIIKISCGLKCRSVTADLHSTFSPSLLVSQMPQHQLILSLSLAIISLLLTPTASKSNKSTSPDSVPTATNRGALGQKSMQRTAELTSSVNFGFGSTSDDRPRRSLPSSSKGLRKSHTQTLQSAPPVIIQSSNPRTSAGWSAFCVEIFITQ